MKFEFEHTKESLKNLGFKDVLDQEEFDKLYVATARLNEAVSVKEKIDNCTANGCNGKCKGSFLFQESPRLYWSFEPARKTLAQNAPLAKLLMSLGAIIGPEKMFDALGVQELGKPEDN